MYLGILKWTLGVLLLCASVVKSSWNDMSLPNMEHSVRVSNSGKNRPECFQNNSTIACKTLDYVFERIKRQSSTVVYVEFGYYNLNKSYSFLHVNDVAIIGLPSVIEPILGEVQVQCQTNAGLSFIYSRNIIMKDIILSSCGAIQNSTSIGHREFLTGLFLVNCINFTMDGVWVTDGPGIGMQLYDVAGIVTISNSQFVRNGKRKQESLEESIPGGGFYFESTFMGGLYPFKTPPELIYQENGTFNFTNVLFAGNNAPKIYVNDSVVNPGGENHIAFGRGGGASFFIKGSARKNKFFFENCHFINNYAEWGAGLFAEFQDNTKANIIKFELCHFKKNHATLGGGAVRAGLITMPQDISSIPNCISFTSCRFQKNRALLGGGISLYGTKKQSYLDHENFIHLTECVIENNLATVGSAFCSNLENTNEYLTGEAFKIFIENSIIKHNEIIDSAYKVDGTGTFYVQGTPVLLNNTQFSFNKKTALVLDNALLQVIGNVSFTNNTGRRGGAIALYGRSNIKVANNSNLTFIENRCSVQGGAIYVRAPGPQMMAFSTTELQIHNCFFSVENCNCSVSFYGNKGPTDTSGHSVYATTLQFCRLPDEDRMNNSALEWKSFHYYYANRSKSNMYYEIVTDAVEMHVHDSDWNTAVGKSFSPVVKLFDEKYHSVYGVIKIEIQSSNHNIKLDPSSTYFLAKDKIQSLQVKARPDTHYNISLSTVDSQLVFRQILNADIKGCKPGFKWKENVCICDCDETNIGVSRCDDEKQMLFLLKGYWGGHVNSSGTFVIAHCPENYCLCNQKSQNGSVTSSGECLFNKDNKCKGNRVNRLCGSCKHGFSLKIGEDECSSDCNPGSYKWIGYLVAILLFLTVLVLIIMRINFDPFSAYLNAWLYSYQVLLILVPSGLSFDPFMTFIIGLAHIRIIGFGGVCMWYNMDDLQKLAFNYILPFYFFICLYVLNKLAVAWPNNFVTRQFTQTSLARAFCTLFVFSYSTVVNVSLCILYPVKIGDEYFVFYQGSVKYFSLYHVWFAILAFILLIFIGIFFPLLLICRHWFTSIDNGFKKLLLDNFQRCFRDGYKWCAGFYFVCRVILLVIPLAIPPGALKVSLLNSVCCIILAVFVLCQPYRDTAAGDTIVPYRILNISDGILLCNLCLISSFGGAASGIYSTRSYYNGLKVVISILSYTPLVFSFGLCTYILRHRYRERNLLLRDVD